VSGAARDEHDYAARNERKRAARITRMVAHRAIRRLDILEWVILGGAGFFALLGGGLVALMMRDLLNLPMRPTWVISAILLFAVPGLLALRRVRRDELASRQRRESTTGNVDG